MDEKSAAESINQTPEVWVFAEQEGRIANPVAFELLGKGRTLAEAVEGRLIAVLLGHQVETLISSMFAYGADKVIVIDDPILTDYRTYPYCAGLVKLVRSYAPDILLLGATTLGRDLAGAVAAAIETGLTADCTELTIDPQTGLMAQTRPAFGGNVMATIVCRERRPQMATVRPRVFKTPTPDFGRRGEIVKETLDVQEEDVPTKVIDFIPRESQDEVGIETADILVAGGRGLGGAENFAILQTLAELLGGDVAASRPPVEMGWIPFSRQVGQSGKTVRPRLFLAVGVSGAVQHTAGMSQSDLIVAVNSDPDAPIFKVADFGLVGDLFELVPAIIAAVRQAKREVDSKPETDTYV